MSIWILDRSFTKLAIVDDYESLIWVDRYNTPGEFEIYARADAKSLEFLKKENILINTESEHGMIIESIRVTTDVEEGSKTIVTGRSLESILGRRIVWKMTDFNNVSLQSAIERLLNENAINPSDTNRKIPNLIFESSTDTAITDLKLSLQVTGDNLLDTIEAICEVEHLGFKITISNDKFVFKLYSGQDRSFKQSKNTYVIFSSNFDNLISSEFYESDVEYKNVTLVAGEDEGEDRKTLEVGTASGLDRKELYTDARDIQSKDEEGEEIPLEEYYARLKQRGNEKLAECKKKTTFEGKCDPYESFVYKEDFFLGDVVQVRNEYGKEGRARITEFTMTHNTSDGLEYYPTFEAEEAEE